VALLALIREYIEEKEQWSVATLNELVCIIVSEIKVCWECIDKSSA
jgi:hypothetical protein